MQGGAGGEDLSIDHARKPFGPVCYPLEPKQLLATKRPSLATPTTKSFHEQLGQNPYYQTQNRRRSLFVRGC